MSLSEKAGQGAQVQVGWLLSNSYHRQPLSFDKKYSLFKWIGLCPITLTTPLVFVFKICMRTPCQIWGNLCKQFYLAYLLLVFSVTFSSYVNHLKIRYVSIHVMNCYVYANMFAFENLLLPIVFGLLLLSVLFCNDSHYGVLSKDFIYGCLVRNQEQDPSMADNFKCLIYRFSQG